MKDLENAYTDSLSAVMASYSTAFITTCLLDQWEKNQSSPVF